MHVKTKFPKVIERKLGREHYPYGQECDGVIEIDPRQTEEEYLATLIHELLHHHLPDLTENQILKIEKNISKILWTAKYRRIRG